LDDSAARHHRPPAVTTLTRFVTDRLQKGDGLEASSLSLITRTA